MAKQRSIAGIKRRRKPSHINSISRPKPEQHISPNLTSPTNMFPSAVTSQSDSAHVVTSSAPPSLSNRLKRQRDKIEDSHGDNEGPPKTFVSLKPRIRYINQDIIKDKWSVLPELLQNRMKDLFKSMERPVITSYRDNRRRIEAQVALGSITRNLGKRLPRMPFPPDTKATDFDYEAILNSNRVLELQLTPSLHSTTLLQAEISKEQRMLDADKVDLAELKRNATASEARRQRQAAKRHKLLGIEKGETSDNCGDSIGFVSESRHQLMLLETGLYLSLHPAISQMKSHLESMENNASQITGVDDVLMRAHAALDRLLQA